MKQIPGYAGYYATEDGRIYSEKTGIFLRQFTQGKPYHKVVVSLNGKRLHRYVHVLVALAYHKKKQNTEVNHKDRNGFNNHKDNLEWITHRENVIHYYQSLQSQPQV